MNFKRLLSYIFPVTIHNTHSEINKNLEVTWNNGRLVLDSKNTNFSFGSLQRVMRIGLNQIGKTKIKNIENTLILGVAGGSVIKTLRDEYLNSGKITGVELDEKSIELANNYFGLNQITNLEIIIDDASEFVKNNSVKYDLVIIDIFQDNIMPDFLFTIDFMENIRRLLNKEGVVLFNSIVVLSSEHERNHNFEKMIRTKFTSVIKLSRVEGDNELFILSND
ncbi:fused MFS/spermidine synthase [Flavobacterium amniphilum]|uniref:spermidine synthase n=1 Tax=Flavobacterium amniphilum TaxID=1834035 RepID=UPI00202A5A1D|nr:fused MFS/spermidine synthase [Flavobacterium amniphilum]MCL9804263.1 fused MFS/spermidine synthase [Flavobacterium amniphilum]